MSGRSGYRKTDRKLNRNAPRQRSDYILRFQLPPILAFSVSTGEHGWGVTIGFNDVVFSHGLNPAHCAQLSADFLDKMGARRQPQAISASIVELLACPAHSPRSDLRKLGIDLEAVHDNISRNAHNWRPCSIIVGVDTIAIIGATPRHIIHDFADRSASDRRRA
jgi:hypothetical protein